MDVPKCKTVEGVMKELSMFTLVNDVVRIVMLDAARRQTVEPTRISFIDALRWLCHARPGEELPVLIVNPARPGRVEPRVIEWRGKQFDLMNRPRREMRLDRNGLKGHERWRGQPVPEAPAYNPAGTAVETATTAIAQVFAARYKQSCSAIGMPIMARPLRIYSCIVERVRE